MTEKIRSSGLLVRAMRPGGTSCVTSRRANEPPSQKREHMNKVKIVSRIEMWLIEGLIPYARNARKHSDKQIRQLAQSIRENGFVNPVLVDQHGNLIAGHGRIL